jgi:L-arabinonolactonase
MSTLTGGERLWPEVRCELGESLLWDERNAAFWWVDVHRGALYRAAPGGGAVEVRRFDEALGHVALTESGDALVLGLASALARFDCVSGALERLVAIPHPAPGMRVNDGRCDRHGHLVFGTMSEGGRGERGAFWRFGARSGLQRLDLPAPAIPNSICFSPDGALLYFADSLQRRINVCDYDPTSGRVDKVRVFADPGAVAWEPDGSCVDADGGLWNARWGGGAIARYFPDGTLDRLVGCAAQQPTCPCLGGANYAGLYVTSAAIGLDGARCAADDGGILAWPLADVRGLPEGRVSGL